MPSGAASGPAAAHRIDRPAPLRERVYQTMQELIISGSLAPGQHLVEGELAEMLGVSRQPIREALQLLNSDGWVDLRPAYGAFVHSPSSEEVDQLLAVRATLESESARLAAAHATEDGVAALRDLCTKGEAALAAGEIDEMVNINAALHRKVTELSGNKVLLDFVSQVDRRVRWYYTPIARRRGADSWKEHAKLIAAISKGDAETAARIMREHTERTRESYLAENSAQPREKPATPVRTRKRRTAPRG